MRAHAHVCMCMRVFVCVCVFRCVCVGACVHVCEWLGQLWTIETLISLISLNSLKGTRFSSANYVCFHEENVVQETLHQIIL